VNNTPPVVAQGYVLTTANVGSTLQLLAFDAAGVDGCSGVPKVCAPLWRGAAGGAITDPQGQEVVVGGDVAYVSQRVASSPSRLLAFDARGITGCTGTPTTCTPLFSSDDAIWGHAVPVGRHLYVPTTPGTLVAYTPSV
jgi:hypothetical protein